MRILLTLGLLTATVFSLAAWYAPASAERAADQSNPYNLPSTHFGSESPASAQGDVAPGFAHASIPANPGAPDARPVGQQVCTACHSKESQNFAHTTHALGMNAA